MALSTSLYPAELIFFCLEFVLDFSRSGKIFSSFLRYEKTVFLGTSHFSETFLLFMLFSKSFNVLHFSSAVLIFRYLFDAIIEKEGIF